MTSLADFKKDLPSEARYRLPPQVKQLAKLFQLLNCYFEENKIPHQHFHDIKLLCEEIFVNIANYSSTEGDVQIMIGHNDSKFFITFVDNGIPFDPLSQAPQPEVGKNDAGIQIGGLGITMIKKISDELCYQRKDGQNHLCVSVSY